MFEVLNSPSSTEKPIKGWTIGVPVEEAAKKQLRNIAGLPFIFKHVAVMPDVHLGIGATIGSVVATKNAIIPAAVGVDLGCGMSAVRTSLVASDLPDNLHEMRSAIEAAVPHGRTDNGGANDRGAWAMGCKLSPEHTVRWAGMVLSLSQIVYSFQKLSKPAERAIKQLGTLGGGNHFIEVCLDEEQRVWIMLHSGSRGIGNAIGSFFIEKAKEEMLRWSISLPDKDLAYLPQGTQVFNDYCDSVRWAQDYAAFNRDVMMGNTIAAIKASLGRDFSTDEEAVNCHHNYVSWERHFGENVIVTRKGAVAAGIGMMGIIPGSMGAKSFIVSGKGERESFCSCSHGAGRIMSRTEAKKKFTLADHIAATAGVECRKDDDVIDETPNAYKRIEDVMRAQEDLVSIVHTLKQVLCVKG